MLILGVTGGTGSGKTAFLREAASRGALVLDCDEIYHELLQTEPALLREIEARFPGVAEGGVLHRKKLGKLVFDDPAALRDLNAITHRHVLREVERRLHAKEADFAVIDAIGLFESGLAGRCFATVAITAPERVRVARIMAREGIGKAYAEARVRAQKPDSYYSGLADYTLTNDYPTEAAFRAAAGRLIEQVKETAHDGKPR